MDIKRLVVKVGTSTITHPNGKLDLLHIDRLCRVISDISNKGVEVVFVTSGAIGVGVSSIGLARRPHDIPGKQAAAAVGQCRLMNIYEKFFAEYGQKVGQILLTKDVLNSTDGVTHVQNTVNRLLDYGVIPIVNENDTVAVDEIKIGDNDTLSAIVSVIIHADILVLLSDIDGLYDRSPQEAGATLIPRVEGITDEIRAMAGGSGSTLGTGGMLTKLDAAEMVTEKGIPMLLAHGEKPECLYDVLSGEFPGTIFLPRK